MSSSGTKDRNKSESFEAGRDAPNIYRKSETAEPEALRKRRVGLNQEKLIIGKTGDSFREVSPAMQYFRVHDIMEQLTAGFERKSDKDRIAEVKELAASSGVEADTSDLEAALNKPTDLESREAESSDEMERAVYKYLKKLAEDIVDALNQHKKSISVIESDDVGAQTTSKLGMKGDVNFAINEQAGMELVESLKLQHTPMKVRRSNNYGFTLVNKDLGLHMVFVYQEGLGGPKTEQSPQNDPEYQDLDELEQKSAGKTAGPEKSAAQSGKSESENTTRAAQGTQPDEVASLAERRAAAQRKAQDRAARNAPTMGDFTIGKNDQDKLAA